MTRQVSPLSSRAHRSLDSLDLSANATRGARTNGSSKQAIRVMLLLSTPLDCESLSALFLMRRRICLVGSSSDLDYGIARCRQLRPQLLIVDPKMDNQAIELAVATMRSDFAQHVIVLDDRVHEGLLTELLAIPAVSYMTRQAGFDALYAAALDTTTDKMRVFDPSIDHRVLRTPRGLRFELHQGRPSVAALTTREREVMLRLAQGNSVRDCAQQMQLAVSTIDNHKSRLMKKLQVHKAVELTRVAIRDGLIRI